MKAFSACLVTAATMILAGCASNQLSITYDSDPPGATIKQANGTSVGRAPVTLNYAVSEADKKRGSMQLMGVGAQWVSGAQLNYTTINANLRNGYSQNLVFKRPDGVSGLSTDMNYALELEKLDEMRRQTAAQQSAALEASRAAAAAEKAAKAERNRTILPPLRSPINCVDSGTLVTCY